MVPKEKLLVYHYIDAFPWMQWSKCFTGETAIRVKLVEPHNLLSSIVTVCSWLGPDNYNHVSNLGRETLQLQKPDKFACLTMKNSIFAHAICIF